MTLSDLHRFSAVAFAVLAGFSDVDNLQAWSLVLAPFAELNLGLACVATDAERFDECLALVQVDVAAGDTSEVRGEIFEKHLPVAQMSVVEVV